MSRHDTRADTSKAMIDECAEKIRRTPVATIDDASCALLEDLLRRRKYPTMRFCVTYKAEDSANVYAQKADSCAKELWEKRRAMARCRRESLISARYSSSPFFVSSHAVQQFGKSARFEGSASADSVSHASSRRFQK